jgi:hypothetical protein
MWKQFAACSPCGWRGITLRGGKIVHAKNFKSKKEAVEAGLGA